MTFVQTLETSCTCLRARQKGKAPPLWLAGTQPSTYAEAARIGLGILGFNATEPDEIVVSIRAYREPWPECNPVGGYANHQVACFTIYNIDTDYTVGLYREVKYSVGEICQMMGISKPTLYNYVHGES